ncbi:phosphoribosylglycinamide formyltransferase [Xanthomonas theicola]|uniref:Phosphoribosylglycinamide formyltransferase n=1 Tax=Xanthomonas theicola TaxID=56464 RepID=A0A2S6ZKJ0_9XANT|nr:phosphoribosylglycinamide formyltransferase [Xanthomonas theicola]PPT92716.1 phosphoribosylglycinamide formyltransferase [Xanthomonas theicola]QNH24365.1 phosphoribosylglycinamide formyltransferase [Xanthomonas theicola]
MTLRLAVLVSGRGSNLQALLDAIAAGTLDAQVVGVFSDRAQAPALAKVAPAQRWTAAPKTFADRDAFDQALGEAVAAAQPDWIVCAGYMRILGDGFVRRFGGRLLNIHPSLLPKYRGLHTHARAIAAGDAEHGASVHFVVPALDAGAVIAQVRVPVLAGDGPRDLAQRLLPGEHRLLCAVLQLAAAGRLAERDGRVWLDGQCRFSPLRLDYQGMLVP